ncbi:hypothetical protein O181_108781 [Austropuccinia psidii MF-1]|uniref:Uncharacterized protein n=1 Tax=Austropuccinia psidii MF-1 TaxID=1389203 RepID=A0A9Q3JVY6_9BASI|nr:hypothetical protein [Austropuccinia psidii MF-1]
MSPEHLGELRFPRNQEEEEEDLGMNPVIKDGRNLREILPTVPFHLNFNRFLQPEDWTDLDQVFQINQLLKSMFQWRMERKIFKLATQLAEAGTATQKICLRYITWV